MKNNLTAEDVTALAVIVAAVNHIRRVTWLTENGPATGTPLRLVTNHGERLTGDDDIRTGALHIITVDDVIDLPIHTAVELINCGEFRVEN